MSLYSSELHLFRPSKQRLFYACILHTDVHTGDPTGGQGGREATKEGSERLRQCGSLLDKPLAEFPQAEGGRRVLSLRRGQTAEAVVEVHPSKTLQLWSHGAVDRSGRSLLLRKDQKDKIRINS